MSPCPFLIVVDSSHTPEEYRQMLLQMGYTFKLHQLDDMVYVNDQPMSDALEHEIMFNLKNAGYNSPQNARDAFTTEAKRNPFHPVRAYLENLEWDGQDHIAKLADCFEYVEEMFPTFLRRWLIGSVAKVMPGSEGSQNRMLIFVGGQGAKKSTFIRWLASPLSQYYVERSIRPDDKDDRIRRATNWIWEVPELGSVTRLADREALKTFLSEQTVTERMPYGHYDIHKPVLANYIGTINDEGTGFLNDPTGSRRFMAATIERIDLDRISEMDVNQVWAQAVALYKGGEQAWLTPEEEAEATVINDTYEVENLLEAAVFRYFTLDPDDTNNVMPATDMLQYLAENRSISQVNKASQMELARVMRDNHIRKAKVTPPGYSKQVWCYIGVKINPSGVSLMTLTAQTALISHR